MTRGKIGLLAVLVFVFGLCALPIWKREAEYRARLRLEEIGQKERADRRAAEDAKEAEERAKSAAASDRRLEIQRLGFEMADLVRQIRASEELAAGNADLAARAREAGNKGDVAKYEEQLRQCRDDIDRLKARHAELQQMQDKLLSKGPRG